MKRREIQAHTIYLPPLLADQVRRAADADHRSFTKYVERLLEQAVAALDDAALNGVARRASPLPARTIVESNPGLNTADLERFVANGNAAQVAVDRAIESTGLVRYSVRAKGPGAGWRVFDADEKKFIAGKFPDRPAAERRCTELNVTPLIKRNGKWPASRVRAGRQL